MMFVRLKPPTATSKYYGVSLCRNKWMAKIRKGNKQEYIGIFETEEEAAQAFNRVAKWIYKDTAILNEV